MAAAAARFRLAGPKRFLRSRRRLRDGWKRRDVAEEMAARAAEGLRQPETVAPFRSFLEVMETLVAEYPLPDHARFLDFGCGTGHYCRLLEQRFPGRFEYVGCDYSEPMIAAARERWPGKTFTVNDVFANRLELGSFDIVFASALVDVVDRPLDALHVLLASDAPYVLLHRQRVTEGRSRVATAAGYEGQTTYRSFLSSSDIEEAARSAGRRLAGTFRVEDGVVSCLFEKLP
jgi:SAM-dependent methyltransferase